VSTIVTGGAGFVGSFVVDALLERGEHVVVFDDLSTGRLANLESALKGDRTTFVHADVSSPVEVLRDLVKRAKPQTPVTAIYHLASPASPDAYSAHPWETLKVNAHGTMALIELAVGFGARFLYTSTSEIYGDPLVHPQPESYFGNVDPIGPRSCYDEGKRFGEAAVAAGIRTFDLDGRIVRLFNCYGPRMAWGDGRLIPELAQAVLDEKPLPIHGDGSQTRSLTYITDAVELILQVGAAPNSDVLHPVNVGAEDERSVLEVAEAFAQAAGVPANFEFLPSRAGDPQRRRPDLTYARSLGWTPRTSLTDGLRQTYAWFAESRLAFV
jgi:nucleoside-diphosphate-sugar epimerase